ncbi:MAG: 50S ribosomal protein L3 [Candidatus Woesebacteria bacterium GW2011_GWC2_31_9]|uniref:50S ribosomal protein L3 n=1 Tax=Candidatus Woesebacteria bacterium GW2011_GWC2_31_9 TaxID=1618586 RepID=A0A0F9Z090_9BACT|nr:MAG: 50S ribosomal protein L3 [Candidatus Woesebacteria bacterium GW2011_GWC2_31_9]
MNTLFGTKGKMTQAFIEGFRIPVTKVTLGPCTVIQIKDINKDGYWAVQLGFGTKKIKNTTKPLQGHSKKSNSTPRYLKEIKLSEKPNFAVGDIIKVGDIFSAGDVISVTAITKGKGFAGGVKRHGFKGGPRTHGQSDRERAPGSIGQTTTPGRVYKGKNVVSVDAEKNELSISSPIPGKAGIFLAVNKIKSGSLKDLEHEVVATVVEVEEAPEDAIKKEEIKEAEVK